MERKRQMRKRKTDNKRKSRNWTAQENNVFAEVLVDTDYFFAVILEQKDQQMSTFLRKFKKNFRLGWRMRNLRFLLFLIIFLTKLSMFVTLFTFKETLAMLNQIIDVKMTSIVTDNQSPNIATFVSLAGQRSLIKYFRD